MIYLLLGLYLFLLVLFYDVMHASRLHRFNFVLAYILMVALMTFRYRVGGDTLNYMSHFDYTTPQLYALRFFVSEKLQPIPAIIFSFCKTVFDDFTYVQAIFAVFVNAVIFNFFKKNTQYVFTAIFLYALTFYMRLNCEIMRESLAVSFFLLGYPYLMKHNYLLYYIYVFIAFMCHSSAIFLFVLPLFLIFNSRRNAFLVLMSFFLTLLIITSINQVMDNIAFYLDYFSDYQSTNYGKLGIILFQILFPLIFLKDYKHCASRFVRFGVYTYIGCGVFSLFFYIAYRFNNYLMPFYILLVTDYLCTLRYRKPYDMPHLKLAVMSFVFLYSFMSPYFRDISHVVGHPARWYCCWYPYYSIFDKQEDPDREAFITHQND